MRRPAALFLLTILLAALLPAAQGEGCRLCGKIGRCCCFLHPAAAPKAHCAMKSGQGGHSACRVARTEGRPAALRASSLPNRTAGTFATFAAAVSGSPLAGRVATAGAQRPVLFRPPPPSPPPLSFRPI